ncbi:MAG TPA: PadR family transcriptional regulator [Bauldia sp.]|nr:PadR family transcriptional regulator [Bauldia sp.]
MHEHWRDARDRLREERMAWSFAGRGGPGGGWGRHGGRGGRGFGGGAFRVGKMLADGDLRVVVLALLADGPRHGYDIIKALEDKSSGIYSPSPGVVYPTLTYLEEAGFVTATSEGNKKVYAITDGGRKHLEENRDLADMVLDSLEKFGRRMAQARAWWEGGKQGGPKPDRDIPGVIDEVNDARRDLKEAIAEKLEDAAEEVQRRVAKALRDAAKAIRGLGNKDDVIDL